MCEYYRIRSRSNNMSGSFSFTCNTWHFHQVLIRPYQTSNRCSPPKKKNRGSKVEKKSLIYDRVELTSDLQTPGGSSGKQIFIFFYSKVIKRAFCLCQQLEARRSSRPVKILVDTLESR